MTTILTGTASARAAAIAERCAQAAWHGTAWQACCPSHYDTQVLLSITSNTDAVLLSCCAGCQPAQIVARLGLTLDDLCVHQPSANGTTPPLPDLETLDALDMEDEAEEGLEPRAWEELTLAEQQALMLDVFTPAEWLTNRGLVVGMLLRRDDRQWYPWKAQAKARGVDAYGYEKTVDKMLADFAGPKTKHTRSRTAQEAEDTAQTTDQAQESAPSDAPSGTGAAFFDYAITSSKRKVFIPRLLAEAIMARGQYRYAASVLWRYRDGAYRPDGDALVREEAQALLGQERREHYLNETLRFIEVATRTDDPRPCPDCINVRNGRVWWRADTLTRTDHDPTLFETVQLPVAFELDATCPLFDQYLISTFEADVIPLAEEILGYCLVPSTRFEKAIMFTGPGGNGKSVFLAVLVALLGAQNVCHVALQDLEGTRFHVAELYGKLANIVADLDARTLKSANKFKQIVTGDRMEGERKNKDPFYFYPYARLIFSANQVPGSADRTLAFYDRWLIIPFTQSFRGQTQEIKGLSEKLRAELPGILNRALTGLRRLFTRDAFTIPASVQHAMEAYIQSNDNVCAFVEECVVIDPNDEIPKRRFYTYYRQWCEQRGERAVTDTRLKGALKQAVPRLDERRDSQNGQRYWLGMKWADTTWNITDVPF